MSMEHNKTSLSLSAKRSGAQQKRLGIHIASGIVSAIIVATIGAVLLLVIVRLATGAYPRRRSWRLVKRENHPGQGLSRFPSSNCASRGQNARHVDTNTTQAPAFV